MTSSLITVLSGNSGMLARWAGSIIVATIVGLIGHFGFQLTEMQTAELSGFSATVVAALISDWVNKRQAKSISTIQEAVKQIAPQVVADGHAGNVTTTAIIQAVGHLAEVKDAGLGGNAAEKHAAAAVKAAMKPPAQ